MKKQVSKRKERTVSESIVHIERTIRKFGDPGGKLRAALEKLKGGSRA